jgi:GNAT superfamily N-acetyltransferase
VEVREMTPAHVEPVARVASGAGWPNLSRHFAFFVRHPRCRAVVALEGGEAIGAACGAANGHAGWVGLVVVSGAHRRRGLGTALTRAVMEVLLQAGCRTLILTATQMGRPLYERLGFEVETFYQGYEAPGLPPAPTRGSMRPYGAEDLPAVRDLDRWATAEDRSALLDSFPEGHLLEDGRGGARGYHARVPWGGGPVIAASLEAGLGLLDLQRRRAGPDGTVRAWLTEENAAGREAIERNGFGKLRRLPRMVLGEPLDWRPETLWGIFSLAKG